MNVHFLNPFIEAAHEVLLAETHFTFTRGDLRLEKEHYLVNEVTVIISLIGEVWGSVFYGMSEKTAMSLSSQMLGDPLTTFEGLAQSGVAELGNVITGRAGVKLARAGYDATISPPTLLRGNGASISTLDFTRLVVPLISDCGSIDIHLALREKAK